MIVKSIKFYNKINFKFVLNKLKNYCIKNKNVLNKKNYLKKMQIDYSIFYCYKIRKQTNNVFEK